MHMILYMHPCFEFIIHKDMWKVTFQIKVVEVYLQGKLNSSPKYHDKTTPGQGAYPMDSRGHPHCTPVDG